MVLLAPNGRLNGYVELRGTAAQLAAVREDVVFRRILVDATMIVDDLRMADGYCNEGVAEAMGIFQEAVAACRSAELLPGAPRRERLGRSAPTKGTSLRSGW